MNTTEPPSPYRYCIGRFSRRTSSSFSPALKVRSITVPFLTFRSLVRTKAPPLPGFTCCCPTTEKSSPSSLITCPLLRSFVEIIFPLPYHDNVLGRFCQHLTPGSGHRDHILNAHAADSGKVYTRLYGYGHVFFQFQIARHLDGRGLMHLQPYAVAEAVAEISAVTGLGDYAPRSRVQPGGGYPRPHRADGLLLGLLHDTVNPLQAGINATDEHGSCQV